MMKNEDVTRLRKYRAVVRSLAMSNATDWGHFNEMNAMAWAIECPI